MNPHCMFAVFSKYIIVLINQCHIITEFFLILASFLITMYFYL